MLFFKDKETIFLWKEKCHKLEKENQRLRKELDAVKEYKEEYEDLVDTVSVVKDRYERLVQDHEDLYNDYKAALDNVMKEFKENIND